MAAPRKASCALGLITALLAWAPAVRAAPVVTEHRAASKEATTGVASGPGQHVFFTAAGDPGVLGRLDVGGGGLVEWIGGTEAAFPSNRKPYDLAEGPDGALWVTESGDKPGLERVAVGGPTGELTGGGLAGSSRLAGIVAGPGQTLWMTDRSGDAAIVRYDATSGQFTTHRLPTKDAKPEDIAVGADGNLWFTEPGGRGRIGRITPSGTVTEFEAGITADSSPWGIAAGPDGALWFTERDAPRIGRITTAGVVTEYDVAGAGELGGIAAGGDGALWFTAGKDPGALGRITTSGEVTLHTDGLTPGRKPAWIAEGPDGNMWFSEGGGDGQVGRITVPPAVGAPIATGPGSDGVTLHAAVRPNAQATTYHVEYGTTQAYGAQSPEAPAGSGLVARPIAVTLTGLAPGTTYHARLVATNAAGTTQSAPMTFTTAAAGSPSVEEPADDDALPPLPAMGEVVVGAPVRGTVRWRTPGGRYATLRAGAGMPPGSVIDATRGRLRLASEIVGGVVQEGEFWGGVFQVRQSRTGDGTTALVLRGALSCPRRTAGKPTARAAARRKKRRGLWGKDDHGRFQTRGRGSVATVRGTRWYTEDRCSGTLTRVTSGAVAVRDLRRKRTVVVRAGHSYLARLRR